MVDDIAPDLDELFRQMLNRIPREDRVQASKIFLLLLDGAQHSLADLMALSFTDEDDIDFALATGIVEESSAHILSRPVAFSRRLDSQCMDLLVCSPTGKRSFWKAASVDYLHRTAKEFLTYSSTQQVLLTYAADRIDMNRYKANVALA